MQSHRTRKVGGLASDERAVAPMKYLWRERWQEDLGDGEFNVATIYGRADGRADLCSGEGTDHPQTYESYEDARRELAEDEYDQDGEREILDESDARPAPARQ